VRGILAAIIISCPLFSLQAQDPRAGLLLQAPITRWDEAIPIGNGFLGGLLWGETSRLVVSLDRGDLWDERLPDLYRAPDWTWTTMQQQVRSGAMDRFHAMFDDPYEQIPYPTKLPGGRLIIERDAGGAVQHFALDLKSAEARALYASDTVRAVALAQVPVLLLRVPGTVRVRLEPPGGVAKLRYADAVIGDDSFVQPAALGFSYAAVVRTRREGKVTLIAVTLATSTESKDPVATGRARADAALDAGWTAATTVHRAWWKRFWATSSVTIPDSALQAHYDLVKYFYGAAARRGAPPVPLQGVWTADEGGLPPWKGDFHNDLNTQMSYLAAHAAGLDDAMLGWLDYLEARLPVFRRFAHDFYQVDGAVVPGVMTLAGAPMAGWGMYSLSPTNAAWVAQSFYLHWRYTGDRRYLADHAYPFVREIGTALAALLHADSRGRLVLPLSSSPEIHDNSRAAFLPPNSTYDQALLTWCFGALGEMAEALGRPIEAVSWRKLRDGLGPLLRAGIDGPLLVARGEGFAQSHRHFSHAMSIHPLGLLNPEGADSLTVRATIREIASRGTDEWTGYSFAWFAAMLARSDQADSSLRYLSDYLKFTLRNGFHANGDQSRSGLSKMTYRPFTLEGNFLAMAAVQEMLLRSAFDEVAVFPATPGRWHDVSFRDLRAEGGWRVSAERRGGRTVRVRVVAGPGGELRLRDPFGGAVPRWSRAGGRREGGVYLFRLRAGEVLEGVVP
jgi:alpha-L-fucosidase 2